MLRSALIHTFSLVFTDEIFVKVQCLSVDLSKEVPKRLFLLQLGATKKSIPGP